MDEPLSNLDAKLRLEMRAEIRRIHNLLGLDHHLRHARPGRGAVARRPHRRAARRHGAPGRHAGGAVRPAGPCRRRRVHGLPQPAAVARAQPAAMARVSVAVGGATLAGTPIETVGSGDAAVAIRPDDLTPGADATDLAAVVETAEYRGRDFFGTAAHGRRHRAVLPLGAQGRARRDGAPRRRSGARARLCARRRHEHANPSPQPAAAATSGCRCACASPSAASTA